MTITKWYSYISIGSKWLVSNTPHGNCSNLRWHSLLQYMQ